MADAMGVNRARQLITVALVAVLATAGAVALPGAASASGSARTSSSPAVAAPRPPSRASRPVISGRPVPAGAGAPRRSCAQPPRGGFACQALRRALEFAPMTAGSAPFGLSPDDLHSAYALPGGTAGTGQTVWIVDAYDDPTAESDLAVYRAQYGLPPCTSGTGCFAKLNQRGVAGSYPATDVHWASEIALDLAMVSATCPNCAIRLVEADAADGNMFAAVDTAVAMGAKFVSLSWGGVDGPSATSLDSHFTAPGVVFAAASGDSGFAGGLSYPSTSPYVVSVGGTSLQRSANARGWTETAWALDGNGAAGSGCSPHEARPGWQNVPSLAVCPMRASSDVSAVADPATGVAVYDTTGGSGWSVFGGTSAATPIIASVYALAGTPAPSDTPPAFPYQRPSGLFDVSGGSTGTCTPVVLCTAGTGWDGPTGLGSPNGVASFVATPPVVSVVSPGRQNGRVGTPVALALTGSDVDSLPLTWSAVGLPPGLSIATGTGAISGTPSAYGTFLVTVTATDTNGAAGSVTFPWSVASDDVTPPTVTLLRPATAVTSTGPVTVSWKGSDAYTGVAYYQVRYARAPYGGGFGAATVPAAWSRITATSVLHSSVLRGYTYCYSVRAVDRVGNASGWTAQRCTVIPLDDRSLTASSGWSRATGSVFWAGTISSGGTRGTTLSRTGAQVTRIAVLATRCSTCGSVGVYVAGRLVGTLNLYGSTAYRVLYQLPRFSYRTGTVVLKVLSTGRRVQIDALVLSRV